MQTLMPTLSPIVPHWPDLPANIGDLDPAIAKLDLSECNLAGAFCYAVFFGFAYCWKFDATLLR